MITLRKLSLILITLFLVSFSSAVSIDEGWNTVSVSEEVSADEILSSNSCDFETYQNEYIWKYDNSVDDWSHPSTLNPEDAFYIYTNNDCSLDIERGSTNVNGMELESGWKMLGLNYEELSIVQSHCSIGSHLEGGDFSFLIGGNWYHPLLTGSNMDNRGYWVYLENSCNVDFDESETPEEPEIEEDYLEFSEASVISSDVSPDESDLVVEFSFDRDSAVSNDVEADLGLHINEESSPTESFTVEDSSDTQELSLEWSVLWDKFGSVQEDVSVQLVLEERLEGDYRWNEDSIDAGDFDIERCSNFESNIDADEWEYDYSPEEISSCLSEVSMDSTSNEGEYDFRIHSEDNGVCGEVELDSTYWDGNGAEVVEIDLDTLEDSSNFRETELMIRHFEGGSQSNSEWITLLQEDLSDIDETSYLVEFVETDEDDTHNYNKVEITLENDYCGGDELDLSGTISYQEYSEDGPGTCKPGETWCGQQDGGGDCIDEDSYSPGLCY